MCLPTESDQKLLACLAGPAVAGVIGGLGAGVLVGAGGALLALVLCASVPSVFLGLRRRATHRRATGER